MGDRRLRALEFTPLPTILGCGEVGFAKLRQTLSPERPRRSPSGNEQNGHTLSLECHSERKDALRVWFAASQKAIPCCSLSVHMPAGNAHHAARPWLE